MFKGLLRKLGLKGPAVDVVDTIASQVADKATGGAATEVDEAVQAVSREVKKRKKPKP
jgi:hypothetical protein